jgi:arabinoxylan arabinofuranohydrolase
MCAALVPAAQAASLELVDDGGFESGSTAGWFNQRGGTLALTDDARSGDQALGVTGRTNTQSGPFLDLAGKLDAGVEYEVSLWLKWTSDVATVTSKSFNLTTWHGGWTFDDRFSVTAQEDTWTELTGTFTLTEEQVTEDLAILVETGWVATAGDNDLMDFVIDDVSVLAPISEEQNLLVNGGFEDGLEPWIGTGNGNSTVTLVDAAQSRTGAGAVHVTERAGTYAGAGQDLDGLLEAGRSYYLSAWVKYDAEAAPATKRFNATAKFGASTYDDFAFTNSTGNGVAAKGEWTEITGTLDVPEGANVADVHLFFETPYVAAGDPNADLMDFYVDDAVLTLLPDDPTPVATDATIPVIGKQIGDHNPLMSHQFGADGNAFVFGDRVYMYMTNDTQEWDPTADSDTNTYARINQITVISSDDLVNWVDHGNINVAGPNGAATWATNSWAPAFSSAIVDGEQKFFLYFCNNGSSVGVLEAPTPTGPWTSPLDGPLVNRNTPGVPTEYSTWYFDPGVFVDNDGQAYLYFGGGDPNPASAVEDAVNNPKSTYVIRLGDDMVSIEGEAEVIDAPNIFEASHVFERDGKYYYSYSTDFTNEGRDPGAPPTGAIAYMMADHPMGPWTPAEFAGTAFVNQSAFFGTGGNNHQSFFELNGEYYFTYHAATVNQKMNQQAGTNISGYRSPHMQEVEFNADGTIIPIQGDYAGVDQVKTLDPFRTIEAETIGWQSGILTKQVERGSVEFGELSTNLVLTALNNGDWTGLSSVDFGEHDEVTFTTAATPLVEGTSVEVRLGSPAGQLVGTVALDGTVGEKGEFSTTLTGVAGTHDLFFVFVGEDDAALAEIDTWAFEGPEAPIEFIDVEGSEHATAIGWLAAEGISTGWSTPSGQEFRPLAQIKRDAMAAFLYRYAGSPEVTLPAESPFVDVTPESTEFYEEIVWMFQEGISTGWETSEGREFRPLAPVKRDAMAAFLYRYAGEPSWTDPGESPFVDVTASSTEFFTEITWLESTGITTGWSSPAGQEYRPLSYTKRDAMATFLYRFNQLDS